MSTQKKIILSSLLVLGIAALTVGVLWAIQQFNSTKEAPITPDPQLPSVNLSAQEIIEQYSTSFSVDGFTKADQPQAAGIVFYPATYRLPLHTTATMQLSGEGDGDAVNESARHYLTSLGFTEYISDVEVGYVLFAAQNVVCQTSLQSTPSSTLFVLSCIDRSDAAEVTSLLDELLGLASVTPESIASAQASPDISEDAKKLKTVMISFKDAQKTPKTLYFATLGGSWEYLGERPIQVESDPDSFTLPGPLKAAISDPKWGGFLLRYIH